MVDVRARHRGGERVPERLAAGRVVDPEMLAERTRDRRESGAAGRVAMPRDDGRRVGETLGQLGDQARFPEAR